MESRRAEKTSLLGEVHPLNFLSRLLLRDEMKRAATGVGLTVRMHLTIRGRVQGVGFRWFTRDTANSLGLVGWVRNLPTGDVEAEAEGDRKALERFIDELKIGLLYARVEQIAIKEITPNGEKEFDIR